MKNLAIIFCLLVLQLTYACEHSSKQVEKEKKVLIIGIDGCHPGVLKGTATPAIDALITNGAYTYKAQTDPISSSGICWTSMLTGVWHEKHNVTTNGYKNPNIKEYPHLFRRIKAYDSDLKTYSIVNWEPIHKILQDGDADLFKTYSPDDKVTKKVVKALEGNDVDVMFVQLDDVDHAGHEYDYRLDSPKYVEAVKTADRQVGEMVAALKRRSNYKNEDWLVIVTTDHGGSNFGHGKDIPEHTTIFYITSGPSANKGQLSNVKVTDVAVTALTHMGIDIKESWKLDGTKQGVK